MDLNVHQKPAVSTTQTGIRNREKEKMRSIFKSRFQNTKKETSSPNSLAHSEPSHANHDVQPAFLCTGVLESPHAVTVNIPECAGGRVHATLASVAERAIRRGGLVNHTLLHNGAVHGEAVGGWSRCVGGGGCRDEGFEDGILWIVAFVLNGFRIVG